VDKQNYKIFSQIFTRKSMEEFQHEIEKIKGDNPDYDLFIQIAGLFPNNIPHIEIGGCKKT